MLFRSGAVTGALNYLTFGIFNSIFGPTGSLTVGIAKFNKMIPILSIGMAIIDAVAGAIWGVVTTIGDVFMGVGELVYYAISPVAEIFRAIGDAVFYILDPLFRFSSKMEKTGSLFSIFANIFGGFGKAIRFVLKTIGLLIGGVIRLFVGVLAPAIRLVGSAIGIVTSIIGSIIDVIYRTGMFVLKFFEGIFTLNIGKVLGSMGSMILSIPSMIYGAISGLASTIYNGMLSIANNDLIAPILQPFIDIFRPINDVIGEVYSSLLDLYRALGTVLDPINNLFGAIFSVFGGNGGGETGGMDLTMMVRGVSNTIGFFIRVALLPLQAIFIGLAAILRPVVWIIEGITYAVRTLVSWANNLVEGILSPFRWLYDVLVGHSIIPDLASMIVKIFGGMSSTLIAGLTNLPSLATSAMSGALTSVGKGFGSVKDIMSKGFSEAANLSKNLFFGFTKGFGRARADQEGFFSSMKNGFSSMMKTGAAESIGGFFKNIGSRAKEAINPFLKGYSRSRDKGEGIFSSIKRGISGQINSSSIGRAGGGVLGKAGGVLGKAGKIGKGILGTAGSVVGSFFGGGEEEGGCCDKTTEAIDSWSVGLDKMKKQNTKGLSDAAEKIAGKSSKGFLGGLKSKIDGGIKSGKGIMGSMFGKSGGSAAGKAGSLLSRGTGFLGGLFGKAGGIASKAGSLFSKGGGLMGSMFGKAGGFIAKAGLGSVGKGLLKKLPGIGAVAGAGFALASLVQGDVGGAVKELASGLAGAVPFIGPVLSAGIDMFGDGLFKGAGQIAASAWEGAKNLGSTLWEGTKNLGSTLWSGAKTVGEGALWLGKKYIDGWKSVGSTLWKGAGWLGDKVMQGAKGVAGFLGFGGVEKAATAGAATAQKMNMPSPIYPVGDVKNVATTAKATDIGEAIKRESTTSESANPGATELSNIAESGQTQVEKLENMITILQQMASYMKPSQSSGSSAAAAGGNTSTNYVAANPAKYYRMTSGQHNQGASKGITNIGQIGK